MKLNRRQPRPRASPRKHELAAIFSWTASRHSCRDWKQWGWSDGRNVRIDPPLRRRHYRQLPSDQCITGFEAENGRNI